LAQVVQTVARHDGKLDEIKRKLATKDNRADLPQAAIEYHVSELGQGILISELDARLRRVEQHLNMPPAA
jgi:hypothetical protein